MTQSSSNSNRKHQQGYQMPYGYSPYADPSQQYYGYPSHQQAQMPQYPQAPAGTTIPGTPSQGLPPSQLPGQLPIEESYIENILRLNKGKLATVYMTFENNDQWNAKIFKGIVEAAGRDHIILSDPETGMRYLLLMIYLDFVTFDEELEYEYPYAQQSPVSTYTPR